MHLIAGMARPAGPITKSTIDALLASAKKQGATAVDLTLPRGVQTRVHFQPVEAPAPTPADSKPDPIPDDDHEIVL